MHDHIAIFQTSLATATNIDTLLAGQSNDELVVPPESVQDKVFFIFNNLSIANMEMKVSKSYLTLYYLSYYPW